MHVQIFINLIQKINGNITLYGEKETSYSLFNNNGSNILKPIINETVQQYFLVSDYDVDPKICPVLKFSYNE